MKDVTTGTDTREPRPLDRSLLAFDLTAELESLRSEPGWVEHGRTSKTLAKAQTFRVVLTLLRAGGTVGDDDVWSPIAVQVLGGAVRADRDGQSVDVPDGGLVWFDAGSGWRVTAVQDAALLLAVSWPVERAVEPAFA
jgi:quercetin dioxygenase-like cupin family protein